MSKVKCTMHQHEMVQILPDLYLCECSAFGRLSYMMGAVEDARALVERVGGVQALRDQIEEKADSKRREQTADKEEAAEARRERKAALMREV